jgi:hypothetical protein
VLLAEALRDDHLAVTMVAEDALKLIGTRAAKRRSQAQMPSRVDHSRPTTELSGGESRNFRPTFARPRVAASNGRCEWSLANDFPPSRVTQLRDTFCLMLSNHDASRARFAVRTHCDAPFLSTITQMAKTLGIVKEISADG